MRFVKTLVLGITLAAAAHGLHAQAKPTSGAGANAGAQTAKPASQPVKPADKPAAQPSAKPAGQAVSAQNKQAAPATNKPVAPAVKPVAATAPKTAAQNAKPATPATKPAAKQAPKQAAKSAASKAAKPKPATTSAPAEEKEPKVAKRDPFESMVGRDQATSTTNKALPPGKAGLQVGTLRLDGIVRSPNGMIAVVSNPQSRTYFLREGDQLYDGRVEKIAMDGVSFHEIGKDAFGKPVERQVNKRIYASAGEQQ
jgi:Tfp pilus assembly protein PilP